ncbi:unnamed protein product [Didymodactylos carnosus]|uniref:Uncharacterized protein n=1 Tax=Didymodactylos carnosus TaxID=1234261 RepID=A0A813RM61_9BILA|nr:unnamed protein product [Didymodactylos carnosus]CAF0900268.1 unnamed protein product [Didymodactylos carnosus]CAF3566761.1 unnamed protein product [Didymodactylos carnosus]CAF3681115.1 unnamed protein product [Didymodactylos carnosus]
MCLDKKSKKKSQESATGEENDTHNQSGLVAENDDFPVLASSATSTATSSFEATRSEMIDISENVRTKTTLTRDQQPTTACAMMNDIIEQFDNTPLIEQKSVVPKSSLISIDDHIVALRPSSPGIIGQPISLYVNHFPAILSSKLRCYHYDIDIKSKLQREKLLDKKLKQDRVVRIPKDIGQRVFVQWRNDYVSQATNTESGANRSQLYGIIFDGKQNIYTCEKLENIDENPSDFQVDVMNNRNVRETFIVQLKLVRSNINMSLLQEYASGHSSLTVHDVQDQFQIMDILFRQGRLEFNFTPLNRSYFDLNTNGNRVADLTNGQELWRGFFQTFRYSGKQLALNVDTSNAVFYKQQTVLDFIYETYSSRNDSRSSGYSSGRGRGGGGYRGRGAYHGGEQRQQPFDIEQCLRDNKHNIEQKLKGLKIITQYLGYEKSDWILKLGETPDLEKFSLTLTNGQKQLISVRDYFKRTHPKVQLNYLPCIITRKNNALPIELCIIVRQPVVKKLDPDITSQIIRHTAVSAPERREMILNKVKSASYVNDPFLKKWQVGLTTTDTPKIEGRVLPSPDINYGANRRLSGTNIVRRGEWNMENFTFYSPAVIRNWAVLNLTHMYEQEVYDYFCQMMNMAKKLGLNITNAEWVDYESCPNDTNLRNVENALTSLVKRNNQSLQLILCIINRKSSEPYGTIKRLCDQKFGIVTQCIQKINVTKKNPQTMANIFLKINPKLGGINSSISSIFPFDKSQGGIMIVGADVSHAASSDNYSVAAIVASTDSYPAHYYVEICLQKHPKGGKSLEMIVNLRLMFANCLKCYRAKNKSLPSIIIFYRDGVSEGQFNIVLRTELLLMQQACQDVDRSYRPKITVIIVQKRHHTRLFPVNSIDECGRSKNIPPGTCVDQYITTPSNFDFYLCSHFGIQGTSRPTHYYVIFDENNFNFDKIQMLTYKLCHTYARATRSVSIPAPVYYAHLAAFRGRVYIKNYDLDNHSQRSGADDDSQKSVNSEPLEIKENLVQNGLIIV